MVTEMKKLILKNGGNMEAILKGTNNYNYLPNKREDAMHTTSTVLEKSELMGHGLVIERKEETTVQRKANTLAFNLIISVVLILAGFAVLKVTGLYDGMESTIGKIGLLTFISSGYLIAFIRGYYAR